MSCNTCTKAQPLIACLEDLQIGLVTPNTTYNVYLRNNTTNRTNIYTSILSDINGILTVSLAELPIKDHSYTLWVNTGGGGYTEQDNIEIDGINYTCFDLKFDKISEYSVTSQRIRI